MNGRIALVVVLHHVMPDGLGGLAMLADLVDGRSDEGPEERRRPRVAPSRRELASDAWTDRLSAPARAPAQLRRLRAAAAQLGASRPATAPHTFLNRPTGSRRAIRVVSVDLAPVVDAGHAHGATVNDVVLRAVTGALVALLAGRGDAASAGRISPRVSTSRDRPGRAGQPGGRGPCVVADQRTPARAAGGRRSHHAGPHDAHAGRINGAAPTGLPRVGGFGPARWFVNHQRLVNTFVTNLRGPADPMTFLRAPVTTLIPVPGIQGNATVAFAVLSYAGTLSITVVVDPDVVPEQLEITTTLRAELDQLTGADSGR